MIASAIDLKGKPVPACFPVSMRVVAAAPAYLGLTEVPLVPPLSAQEVLEEEEEAELRRLGPWGVQTKQRSFEDEPREEKVALACATRLLLAHGGYAETDEAEALLKEQRHDGIWEGPSLIERARCCRVVLERSGQHLDWTDKSCAETTRTVFCHVLASSGCDPSVARDVNTLLGDLDRFGRTLLPNLMRGSSTLKHTLAEGLSMLLQFDQQDRPRRKPRPVG